MRNKVIYTDDDEVIGRYSDMKNELINEIKKSLKNNDFEVAGDYIEILKELDDWKKSKRLLIVSNNNGMGLTVKPYKEGRK